MKIRWPFISYKRDQDMSEEMAFHLESKTRELVSGGMNEADARLEARRRFGSVLKQKEAGHEIRTGHFFENVLRDARHMGRGLRRSPGFTIAVVLTLALGIGANTAIFSIVDQVLLRPLPYPEGDKLVMVYESAVESRKQRLAGELAGLAARQPHARMRSRRGRRRSDILTGAGEATRSGCRPSRASSSRCCASRRCSAARSQRGRRPAECAASGADQPSSLAEPVRRRRRTSLAASSSSTIRPIRSSASCRRDFASCIQDIDVWAAAQLDRNAPWRETEGRFINVVGRLKADTDLETARADMDRIGRRLASMYEFNKNSSVVLVPLREVLTGTVETSLLILYLAVGVLLAIACFNIANLLIARAASRRQEIAVRTSLGAGRGAIVRQLLVESMLLALAGGALGIALAQWTPRCARRLCAGHSAARRAGAADRHARADVRGRIVGVDRARRRPCALVHRGPSLGRQLAEREQLARHALAAHPSGACRCAGGHDRRAAVRRRPAGAHGDCPQRTSSHGFEQHGLVTMRSPVARAVSGRASDGVLSRRARRDSRAARSRFGCRRNEPAGCRSVREPERASMLRHSGRSALADAERDDPRRHAGILPHAAHSSAATDANLRRR